MLRDVEEASEVDCQHVGEVRRRIVHEGLGDEDAGIVDENIDSPEVLDGSRNDPLGNGRIGDVARYRQDIGIIARVDRARVGHDTVTALTESLDAPAPMP